MAPALPLAYVGAMGSRRTHDDRMARLREAGVAPAALIRRPSRSAVDPMWNNADRVRHRAGPAIHSGAFVPVTANLAKLIDKEYQDKSLAELVDAPVAALAGISERTASHLKEALGIKTIGELGRSQYFRTAMALVDLADHGE